MLSRVRASFRRSGHFTTSFRLPGIRPAYRFLNMAATSEIDIEGLQANYRGVIQRIQAAQEAAGAQHVSAAAEPILSSFLTVLLCTDQVGCCEQVQARGSHSGCL